MKMINKLERKFGRYAIKNLMFYLVVLYTIGFVFTFALPGLYETYLCLDPAMILKGQVWRLVTWLMYPPSGNMIFGLLFIYVYFMLGRQIEMLYGAFRFNIFVFGGLLLNVAAAFLCYALRRVIGTYVILTPVNFNYTIFLLNMLVYPDAVFLLFFVIPIKAKYLAVVYGILALQSFLMGGLSAKVEIIAALIHFLFFYFVVVKEQRDNLTRRMERMKAAAAGAREKIIRLQREENGPGTQTDSDNAESGAPRRQPAGKIKAPHHKCAVCGRTELDAPELTFRFCTKCEGDYEYCEEHLHTHIHVVKNDV